MSLLEWKGGFKGNISNPKNIKGSLKSRAGWLEMMVQRQAEKRKCVTKWIFPLIITQYNICGESNYLQNCAAFLRMSVSDRNKRVSSIENQINNDKGP